MIKNFSLKPISVENISALPSYKRIERAGRVCYRSEDKITDESAKTFVANITRRKHYSVLGHSRLLIRTNAIGAYRLINHCPQQLKSHFILCEIIDTEDYLIGAGFDIWLQLFQESTQTAMENAFIDGFPEIFGHLPRCTVDLDIPVDFNSTDKLKLYELPTLHLNAETFIVTADRATAMQLRTYRNAAHSVESQRYCNYTKKGFNYIMPSEARESKDIKDMWVDAKEAEVSRYRAFIDAGLKPEFARNTLGQDIVTQHAITASLWEWKHIFDARLNNHTQSNCREAVQLIKDNLLQKYAGSYITDFINS